MSDSEDDDWWSKDVADLIVIDPKKSVENKFQGEEDDQKEKDERSSVYMLKDLNNKTNCFESEYGGSYNPPKASSKGKHKRTVKSDGNYLQALSLKRLLMISELSTLDIFVELSQVHDEFLETITRTNNSNEVFECLLKIIAKICEIPLFENRKVFLTKISETKIFWKQILLYCKEHESIKKPKNKKKVIIRKCFVEVLTDLLVYCKSVEKTLKLKFVKELCEILKVSKEVESLGEILVSFEELRIVLEAPDVKEIEEIYPTLDDIHNDNPVYLKPNITKGRYPDVKSYLDIHLSLLREDFIGPLRDDITEYKNSSNNNNLRVYPKVRLVISENSNSTQKQKGEVILVDLEPDSRDLHKSKLKDFKSHPKSFMYGSLLCFSTNSKFTDLILGTVSNRDADLLNKGFIQVELVKVYNAAINIFEVDLILMECDIFFESYNHVYRVLKELNEDNFPMKKYIIENYSSPEYPSYIPDTPKVLYDYKNISFNLKDISTWPQRSLINLNQKQYEAFHSALTRKFCIIQGPPGTGKSFIGLEIIATLLQNTKQQILVICYTNHALDQFLTGLLKYTDSLVRMGGQSKNEILEQFNIKKLFENNFSDKASQTWYYNIKKEYSSLMEDFERLQNHFKICEEHEKQNLLDEIYKIQNQLKSASRRLEELKQIGDYNVIKDKRVIGMTTTLAARCHGLLQLLQTPIVLVEEAAEILESHIVAALTNHTQHLILIGDHKQLRPSTSVYKIAKEYKMDISLFERMVNNGINSTRLNIQHRMRPEISRLVRTTTYPDLEDSDSVQRYSSVKGMMNDMFFIDHSNHENKSGDETSKKNLYESQYLLGLCNYLIHQGYSSEDITILTTYNGQMGHMMQASKKYHKLQNVRITVVDNYQGEECKIILLSLVRSNKENKIGYLTMKNRICVAMSRAQQGFYIIGNMTVLCNASNVWKTLKSEFEEQNCIGSELALKCQEHGTVTNIRTPSDFDSFSSGGCHHICESLSNSGQ